MGFSNKIPEKYAATWTQQEGLDPLHHQSLQSTSRTSRDAPTLRKRTLKNVQLLGFVWGLCFSKMPEKSGCLWAASHY